MTQYKLIAREPTEEMYVGTEDMFDRGYARASFQVMFDAAPDIETEAEKKAQRFLKTSGLSKLALNEPAYLDAVEIIRALLRERGRIK